MVEHFMVIGLYHTQHNKRVKCVAAKVAKGNWRNVLQQESTHKKKEKNIWKSRSYSISHIHQYLNRNQQDLQVFIIILNKPTKHQIRTSYYHANGQKF